MTYPESIDWLFSTQFFGIKLGLDGPRRLLRQFLAFPAHGVTVIQVAGTNGKGSVCAMIDAVARAAGRRTGLFTSPHLVDFRERIRVSGGEIPEDECARILTELRPRCESSDPHPTFFEITLACAMRHFRDRGCELIILETGMGGRFDATTAVPADVAVITPVDLDHQQWLGDTIAAIAGEKAAILRPGKPGISAPQHPDARRVIEQEANERRAPLEFVEDPLRGYPIALAGRHQPWNAALALHALHAAGVPLAYDTVYHGLASVRWPGRFESFDLTEKAVSPRATLDGAHNPHAALALAETWLDQFGSQRCTLVFSAVAGKDAAGILQHLAPLAARIFLCPVASPRAVPASEIATALPAGSPPHRCFDSAAEAFAEALLHPDPVLVAGSLFLVGEIRAILTDTCHRPSTQ